MANLFERRRAAKSFADNSKAELASIVLVTTSITLDPALHHNKILQVDSATNITLTLPANAPAGFVFAVDQIGVGKAIFATAGAATKRNYSNFDRTAGQDAQMSGYVRSNAAGNNAVYALSGEGAIA